LQELCRGSLVRAASCQGDRGAFAAPSAGVRARTCTLAWQSSSGNRAVRQRL